MDFQEGLTLPRGATKVVGAMGRSDVWFLGAEVSFFGFLAILLLRCSPLAMFVSLVGIPKRDAVYGKPQTRPDPLVADPNPGWGAIT
jgi:hypothetical protein